MVYSREETMKIALIGPHDELYDTNPIYKFHVDTIAAMLVPAMEGIVDNAIKMQERDKKIYGTITGRVSSHEPSVIEIEFDGDY